MSSSYVLFSWKLTCWAINVVFAVRHIPNVDLSTEYLKLRAIELDCYLDFVRRIALIESPDITDYEIDGSLFTTMNMPIVL